MCYMMAVYEICEERVEKKKDDCTRLSTNRGKIVKGFARKTSLFIFQQFPMVKLHIFVNVEQ